MKLADVVFSLAPSGEVVHPNLHDGRLLGIYLRDDGAVDVFVSDEAGIDYRFRLVGVERLRADDFRRGNIILSAKVLRPAGIQIHHVAYAFPELNDEGEDLQRILDSIKKDELSILLIDPSYGCTLTAICQQVRMLRSERCCL